MRIRLVVAFVSAVLVGCGPQDCKLDDPKTCAQGLVCAPITGKEKPRCFAPVQLKGTVKDLASGAAVADADVAALDVNGASVGALATSGADGSFTLSVPSTRTDEKGTPATTRLTLRAGAQGYANFPSGLRIALPVDVAATSTGENKPWVFQSALTDVGLVRLPQTQQGRPSVSGTVELSPGASALVVVEGMGEAHSAIADASGAFRVFNVPTGGGQTAQAYVKGVNYTKVNVDVQSGTGPTGVAIKKSAQATGTLQGSVQLVAGANGAGTSVVVVLESTFNENLARGEAIAGLRAPADGAQAPNVTGAWTIEGVPDGEYVVLAAFENDGNVRDPDPNISGTQLARITVAQGVASQNPVFKVTGAIELVGPGASGELEPVSGNPLFQWKPYPSARTYDLRVYDAFGVEVWRQPLVLDVKNPQGNVEQAYNGPTLTVGLPYQWRLTARANLGNAISTSEELRGLFTAK